MGFRGGGRGGGGGGRGGAKRPYGGDSHGGSFDKRPRFQVDLNPPNIVPVGKVSHVAENKIVCKVSLEDKVPMFNQPVFLENKTHIGKSDEIFGQLNNILMSVELNETIKPESLTQKQIVYMDPYKITPKERFLPKDPPDPLEPKKKRPAGQGGFNGRGRGGPRGGGQRGGAGRGGGFQRGGGSFAGRGGYNNNYNSPAGGRGGRGGYNNYNNQAGGARGGASGDRGGGRGAWSARGGGGGRGFSRLH